MGKTNFKCNNRHVFNLNFIKVQIINAVLIALMCIKLVHGCQKVEPFFNKDFHTEISTPSSCLETVDYIGTNQKMHITIVTDTVFGYVTKFYTEKYDWENSYVVRPKTLDCGSESANVLTEVFDIDHTYIREVKSYFSSENGYLMNIWIKYKYEEADGSISETTWESTRISTDGQKEGKVAYASDDMFDDIDVHYELSHDGVNMIIKQLDFYESGDCKCDQDIYLIDPTTMLTSLCADSVQQSDSQVLTGFYTQHRPITDFSTYTDFYCFAREMQLDITQINNYVSTDYSSANPSPITITLKLDTPPVTQLTETVTLIFTPPSWATHIIVADMTASFLVEMKILEVTGWVDSSTSLAMPQVYGHNQLLWGDFVSQALTLTVLNNQCVTTYTNNIVSFTATNSLNIPMDIVKTPGNTSPQLQITVPVGSITENQILVDVSVTDIVMQETTNNHQYTETIPDLTFQIQFNNCIEDTYQTQGWSAEPMKVFFNSQTNTYDEVLYSPLVSSFGNIICGNQFYTYTNLDGSPNLDIALVQSPQEPSQLQFLWYGSRKLASYFLEPTYVNVEITDLDGLTFSATDSIQYMVFINVDPQTIEEAIYIEYDEVSEKFPSHHIHVQLPSLLPADAYDLDFDFATDLSTTLWVQFQTEKNSAELDITPTEKQASSSHQITLFILYQGQQVQQIIYNITIGDLPIPVVQTYVIQYPPYFSNPPDISYNVPCGQVNSYIFGEVRDGYDQTHDIGDGVILAEFETFNDTSSSFVSFQEESVRLIVQANQIMSNKSQQYDFEITLEDLSTQTSTGQHLKTVYPISITVLPCMSFNITDTTGITEEEVEEEDPIDQFIPQVVQQRELTDYEERNKVAFIEFSDFDGDGSWEFDEIIEIIDLIDASLSPPSKLNLTDKEIEKLLELMLSISREQDRALNQSENIEQELTEEENKFRAQYGAIKVRRQELDPILTEIIIERDYYNNTLGKIFHMSWLLNFYFGIPAYNMQAQIIDISNTGLVEVKFNKPLVLSEDIIYLMKDETLSVKVIPALDQNPLKTKFTWISLDFSQQILKLQIMFETPEFISTFQERDVLQVEFIIPEIFRDENSQLTQDSYIITRDIPPQLDQGLAGQLQGAAQTAQSTTSTTIAANIVLSLFLGITLTHIWSMINGMQIMVHLFLINVTFPANISMIIEFIMQIATFDLIENEGFYEPMNLTEDNLPYLNSFGDVGYESKNIIKNMGIVLFIYFWINCSIMVLILLLKFLKTKETRCSTKINKVYTSLHKNFIWNGVIRFMLEGFLEFSITCIISSNNIKVNSWGDFLSIAMTLFLFTLITVFPMIIMVKFLNIKTEDEQRKFDLKYEQFYHQLNVSSLKKSTMIFPFLFMTRRLVITAIVVFLFEYSYFQIQAMFYLQKIVFIFSGWVQPYKNKSENRHEIYNEFLLIVFMYNLLLFSDFVPSSEDKFLVAWWTAGMLGLFLLSNMILISVFSAQACCHKAKKTKVIRRLSMRYKKKVANNSLTTIPGNQSSIKIDTVDGFKHRKRVQNTNERLNIFKEFQRSKTLLKQKNLISLSKISEVEDDRSSITAQSELIEPRLRRANYLKQTEIPIDLDWAEYEVQQMGKKQEVDDLDQQQKSTVNRQNTPKAQEIENKSERQQPQNSNTITPDGNSKEEEGVNDKKEDDQVEQILNYLEDKKSKQEADEQFLKQFEQQQMEQRQKVVKISGNNGQNIFIDFEQIKVPKTDRKNLMPKKQDRLMNILSKMEKYNQNEYQTTHEQKQYVRQNNTRKE